ncbi:MAG: helicase, RecD/TraA family [Acidobacteria bacterium]|nr:helicase, RecD/TraA family [Acidobacteriota bacterium]
MPETIHATVQRIRYHNAESGFTVLIAVDETTHQELTIVGSFPLVDEREPIVASGEWRNDRKWGRQFAAEALSVIIPTSREGIQRYLAAGHVKGIGATLAKRLLDKFGIELLKIIDVNPERLLELPGIGKKKLAKIAESWNEQRGVRELMVFLAQYGLGGARAFRIHKQYGDRAVPIIRENPYRLADDVRGIGFRTADAISRNLGNDPQSPFRIAAGLRHVVDAAREGGHCGIAEEEAIRNAVELLAVPAALIEEGIRIAIGGGLFAVEELEGRRVLFPLALHRAETRIGHTLAALAHEKPPWKKVKVEPAIDRAELAADIALDPYQREAIRTVLRSKVAVITGGPGVGKTTLVNAILTIFSELEVKVLLAAPTGRAAKRLSESTSAGAQTIHRLLEMNPEVGGFQRNEDNRLDCDLVIVDETSMVDVPLLDALLRAMPERAGLILVGDADQLPSIGPGQVLHDILATELIPAVRLTHIHRQAEGSHIIVNAHRINSGEPPRFPPPGEQSDMFFWPVKSGEDAVKRIVELVTERIPKKFGMHALRDMQVLAPMRNGTAGVHNLNDALQRALNPREKHQARVERPNNIVFLRGDKVMQMENNYDKNVFNGDVGVIARIDMENDQLTVDFGGETIVDYAFDEADQLTLAYATTIHKSQGSEYPAVIITLMPQHQIMLRRNLLYTAVTRGRKLVVLVGDPRSIDTAVRTGRGGERVTRLRTCIAEGDALARTAVGVPESEPGMR